jgi:hypothetical protein
MMQFGKDNGHPQSVPRLKAIQGHRLRPKKDVLTLLAGAMLGQKDRMQMAGRGACGQGLRGSDRDHLGSKEIRRLRGHSQCDALSPPAGSQLHGSCR